MSSTESGSPSSGEWGVADQGQFWSFWPPTYRATYDVFWTTDADGHVVGIQSRTLKWMALGTIGVLLAIEILVGLWR